MREIKFRAWDKKSQSMHNVGFKIGSGGLAEPLPFYWENEPELILMQYTGLKDKNGKEIYEGDIVKEWNNQIRSVIWENGSFFMKEHLVGGIKTLFESRLEDCEVIGNFYENLELLTKKRKIKNYKE